MKHYEYSTRVYRTSELEQKLDAMFANMRQSPLIKRNLILVPLGIFKRRTLVIIEHVERRQ